METPRCLCPTFAPHQPGCQYSKLLGGTAGPDLSQQLRESIAAAKVRTQLKATQKAMVPEPKIETPAVMIPEGGPVAPNQVLHHIQSQIEDCKLLVTAWMDADGSWIVDWSDATPGLLLEAATAMRLEAEAAWCEVQDQLDGDEPLDEDPDE